MRPISPAREYDVHSLAELNNRFVDQGLTLPRSEAFVQAHIDDYRVIRDDDGRIVGCVCVDDYSPSLAELVSLAVDPEHQGKGLGTALIAAAVELARKRGYPELFAVSFSDGLFLNSGFKRVDVERYPEKKHRYDRISADEWTVGQKHCFAVQLTENGHHA
ncbi:MAG: GNAT family N-acetyltransferase [Gemmatimonadota bacterium]